MIVSNLVLILLLLYSKLYITLKYQCNGSNDYIAVNVYSFKRLLAYSMEVPIIGIDASNDSLWVKSKIKVARSQDETHIKREQRFIKKTMKIYLLHPSKLRHIVRLIRYYTHLYYKFMDRLMHFFHCEQLQWKTVYGSEDAARTGIGTGLLWTVKTFMINRLKKHVLVMEQPIINVNPIFGSTVFKVDFQCIFSIRVGNLINAMRILYTMKH